jgi:hypothetical protein
VLLSLLYRLVRCSLGVLAVLVRSDLSKDVELLVLRQRTRCSAATCVAGPDGITPTGSGLRRCRGW